MGQPLIGYPLYGSRKEEASFAHGRLNALALWLFESLCVGRYVVAPVEANDPWEDIGGHRRT